MFLRGLFLFLFSESLFLFLFLIFLLLFLLLHQVLHFFFDISFDIVFEDGGTNPNSFEVDALL